MPIHSRDKSLSLNFCFIIGYPPYAYLRANICENHEKRERYAYLMHKNDKNTARRNPIHYQNPIQEPSINVNTVDNDHSKANTSS